MADHYPLLIVGAGASAARLEVTAPYDGTLLATLDTADADAVDHALAVAHELFCDRSRWLTIGSPARSRHAAATPMPRR